MLNLNYFTTCSELSLESTSSSTLKRAWYAKANATANKLVSYESRHTNYNMGTIWISMLKVTVRHKFLGSFFYTLVMFACIKKCFFT